MRLDRSAGSTGQLIPVCWRISAAVTSARTAAKEPTGLLESASVVLVDDVFGRLGKEFDQGVGGLLLIGPEADFPKTTLAKRHRRHHLVAREAGDGDRCADISGVAQSH
jgi:hypothetical protein